MDGPPARIRPERRRTLPSSTRLSSLSYTRSVSSVSQNHLKGPHDSRQMRGTEDGPRGGSSSHPSLKRKRRGGRDVATAGSTGSAGSLDGSDVLDLSNLRSDEEARAHRGKESSTVHRGNADWLRPVSTPELIEVGSDEDGQSPSTSHPDRKHVETVDLDKVPDRNLPIDIASDDEEDGDDAGISLDEYAIHEYIGSFHTKIVGIQYYRGAVTTSESVFLRREPNNAYDVNAIQVLNVNSAQVGHLPARISMGLAPWLDNRICLVEASVKAKKQVYSIPITIDVFAHGSVANEIPTALARAGIQLAPRHDIHRVQTASVDDTSGPPADAIIGTTQINTRQAVALLDDLTVTAKDLQAMKKATQPRRLKTRLLDYQLQGLQWMIEKENPIAPTGSGSTQMWKKTKGKGRGFIHLASNFTSEDEPRFGRGGLLADDMGLGKTLQMLSLIVAEPDKHPTGKVVEVSAEREYSRATLVLCPASLMSNWTAQSLHHASNEFRINMEVYHGKSRSAKKTLESRELVISTYGTLKSEFKTSLEKGKAKSGLFSVQWKRVILDEAHQIRNPKSQVSLAVSQLRSSRHWALTGTPIVNSYNDLASIIRFVGWTGGIESPEIFNAKLTRKLMSPGVDVQREAVKLIQILMHDLSLRRRKDMEFAGKRLVDLPKMTEYLHKLKFATTAEQELYDKLAQQAKGILRSNSQQSQVLEILLRMRQACCAPSLISEERLQMLEKLENMGEAIDFTPENKVLLWEFLSLAIESQDTCPICLDYLSDNARIPVVTYCKHVYCKQCISSSIASKPSCPLCRAALNDAQVLELPVQPDETIKSEVHLEPNSSTKIEGLISILRAIGAKDSSNKTVVFSQWTGLLDLIGARLVTEKFAYCRVDGSMTLKARDDAIQQLQDTGHGTVSIMLASLAVASVGLNLTAANSVILLDPWWALAIEEQAIDRVYRLGQTREVSVYRMVIEDSIEEKVLEIQDRKRKMTATIGAGQNRVQQTEARRADLEALLGS